MSAVLDGGGAAALGASAATSGTSGGVAGPLVSVVIPCYDQARFLGEAIESVRRQSHCPVELIVVDDGSTDDTARVAAAHPGVRYVRQRNQGLAAARNTGLRESSGEYVAFLDADDRLLPHALEAGLDCLRAHPEAAFAAGHYRFVDADGSPLRQHAPEPMDGDAYRAFLRGNFIGMHAAVIYRREMLEAAGGFDPTLRACEDYDLYLRLARRHPVCRHGSVVAEYRQHDANMSGDTRLMLASALAVLERQAEHARGDPDSERALRAGVAGWKRHYARQLARQLFLGGRASHDRRETMRGIQAVARYGPGWAAEGLLERSEGIRHRVAEAAARLVPSGTLRAASSWLRRVPPPGQVDLGELRRVTPISNVFGYDRGLPVDRHYIEGFLARNADAVHGRVLEVGDDAYTRRFGGDRVVRSDILHVNADNPRATIVADLTSAEHIPSDAFDCIILTQTLHLIYDARAALSTLHRILRPGGTLLATFPGISQIDRGEWGDTWFWGFTLASATRLFHEVFPAGAVALETHGNVLTAIAFLHGLAVEELRPEELDAHDPHYQVIIAARAVKPEATP